METYKYSLKPDVVEIIFKKIMEKFKGSFEVVQIYKSADDYSSLILSNPKLSPEILFEEELNEVASEHKNSAVIYGNLNYGIERTLEYLFVFINKILVAQLYADEKEGKSDLIVKLRKNHYEDTINLIKDIIKENTLFVQ